MNDCIGKTVLLVEDEPAIALDEQLTLEESGFKVITVFSGEEALSLMENPDPVDLVLMDVNLGSGMDGTETAARILKDYDVPLIFLSSHSERSVVEKISGITSYGFISKDSGPAVLVASIIMAFRLFDAKRLEIQKENELLQNQEDTRIMFNAISDPVLVFPYNGVSFGKFLEVNDTACHLYGYSRDTFLSLHLDDISCKNETGVEKGANILKQLSIDNPITYEDCHLCADGRTFPAEIKVTLKLINRQRLAIAVVRDISARRKTEEMLILSEKNNSALINGMSDTAWVIALDSSIIDVNRIAVEKLGYSREELIEIGLSGIDHYLTSEKIAALVGNMPEDKVQVFETVHTRKDGSEIPVEISSSLVTYSGEPAILSVARDITERKWAEKQIQQQLEEKEALLKAVHHRLKNNMASVESLLHLQARTVTHPEARDALRDAIGRVECVRILYDMLLNTSNFTEMSSKTFLESIVDSLMELFCEGDRVEVIVDADDFPIKVQILFHLGVVIEELVTNSLKYAFPEPETGQIRVSMLRDGDMAVLTVHDNGKGFPDNMKNEKSSGFGLMIVRMLTKQLSAELVMENRDGAFCRFEFSI